MTASRHPDFDAMERRLLASVRQRRSQHQHHRVLLLAGGIAAVATIGVTAAIFLAPRGFTERGVYCFETADLNSHKVEVATPDALDGRPISIPDRTRNAEDLCAGAWVAGLIDGRQHAESPPLDVCLTSDQALAALPVRREEVGTACETRGLSRPE